jgi:hypothetical protein
MKQLHPNHYYPQMAQMNTDANPPKGFYLCPSVSSVDNKTYCFSDQELIASLFRISLAGEKIRKEKIRGTRAAADTHNLVGQEVPQTIQRVNGTLPENHPASGKSIAQIQREQFKKLKSKKTLMLDE